MKVIYSPEALDDLQAYVAHIATRDPDAAARLAQRVFAVIDQLAKGAFKEPEYQLRSGARVRGWPAYPLRIYYRRTAESFSVLRIYHQARRPIVK